MSAYHPPETKHESGLFIEQIAFADFSTYRLDGLDPSRVNLLGRMKATPDESMLLDRSQYSLLLSKVAGLDAGTGLTATFEEKEEFRLSRERSDRHGVYFGNLILRSMVAIDAPDFVAVKPHFTSREALHEIGANNYINSISQYERGFVPLGVWKAKDQVNLLTLFDQPVQTYDNIFWATDEQAPFITQEKVIRALGVCSYGVGYLHGAGAIHEDAQPKNLASDRKRVRYVDLETMKFVERDGNEIVKSEHSRDQMLRDVSQMMSTLLGRGEVDHLIVSALQNERVMRAAFKGYGTGVTKGARQAHLNFPSEMRIGYDEFIGFAIRAVQTEAIQNSFR